MRKGNAEQLKAIDHHGGVLLSAGAGSGKTFVLVHHLLHLALQEIKKNEDLGRDEREFLVKKKFSSIVLMTFTKKATGELKIRLRNLANECDETPEVKRLVNEAFGEIHISTIHGYCSRLIGMGLIPNLPPGILILSDLEFRNKVSSLFDHWLGRVLEGDHSYEPWLLDVLFLNKAQLLLSLREVFATPELRARWRDFDIDDAVELDIDKFIADYARLIGLPDPQESARELNLLDFTQYSKNKWYALTEKLLNFFTTTSLYEDGGLDKYETFFSEISRLTGPQAKLGLSDVNEFFDNVKEIRDFVRGELAASLKVYQEHKDGAYKAWLSLFKNAFDFMDERYLDGDGLTFSDLEFYVLEGLKDPQVADQVAKTYSYFIIDEFQDTSFIQYEIIQRSAKRDMTRIFCVGDVKQAIYGFRGGELGVFSDCQEKIPLNLELKNNYRSDPHIITFNNLFFDQLFSLGLEFQGEDNFSVDVTPQVVPEEREYESEGEVVHYKLNVSLAEDDPRPSNDDISFYEAQALFELIKERQSIDNKTICVLYKTLKPSFHLIDLLMENNLGFTAQVKLAIPEDPIMGLFMLVLTGLDKTSLSPGYIKLFKAFLNYCEVENVDIESEVQWVRDNYPLKGLYQTFFELAWKFKISNSNYSINLKSLESLLRMVGEDFDKIKLSFSDLSDLEFSFDFAYGESSQGIIIQTAHGSKGLQYPHVMVGGIHTNGYRPPNKSYYGKLPGSFRWKSARNQKKPYKSPIYLYESALEQRKDFSESKRLFYVASTRAESTFSFVDISIDGTPFSHNGNSWICGLRTVLDQIKLPFSLTVLEKERSPEGIIDGTNVEAPLFHRDTLGVTSTLALERGPLGLVGNMAVTGLSQIALCPRKFYLSQVCRTNSEDLVESRKDFFLEDDQGVIVQAPTSSAQRGTFLHEVLSRALNHNFVVSLADGAQLAEKDREAIDWTLGHIKGWTQSREAIQSEILMKFNLFGHMIAGTADLIITDKIHRIVDFKTGKLKTEQNDHYWMQLMLYAYGLKQLESLDSSISFELHLMYIDEKEILSKTMTYSEIEEYLFHQWKKTAHLNQISSTHCSSCSFGNLCLPST